MKLEGRITYWNAQKSFGVVETRTPENTGISISRYFLHQSQVVFQAVEAIHEQCFVRFEVRQRPQRRPGDLPQAGLAEVFETARQAQAPKDGAQC